MFAPHPARSSCQDGACSAVLPQSQPLVHQATAPPQLQGLAGDGLGSPLAAVKGFNAPGVVDDDGLSQLLINVQEVLASQRRVEKALASIVDGQSKASIALADVREDLGRLGGVAEVFQHSSSPKIRTKSMMCRQTDAVKSARKSDTGDWSVQSWGRSKSGLEDCNFVSPLPKTLTAGELSFGIHKKPTSAKAVQRLMSNVQFSTAVGIFHQESGVRGKLLNLVGSTSFHAFFAIVVLLECAFVFYSVDYEMAHIRDGEEPSNLLTVGQLIFIALYSMELALKLAAFGLKFFWGPSSAWNIFDAVLLAFSVVDLSLSAGKKSATFVKVLRFVKVVENLRVLRFVKTFPRLSLICTSMINSMSTLAYSVLLMVITLYIFSILFVQGAVSHLESGWSDLTSETLDELYDTFGSVSQAMINLYMSCTNGVDWADTYKIASSLGSFYAWFFLFFNLFVQVAVLNIITSMFVERVMKQAQHDTDEAEAKFLLRRRSKETDRWHNFVTYIDTNHNGNLNERAFAECCKSPDWERYWASLGLDVLDVENFFHMLVKTTDSGEVDLDRFVSGCMKLSGSASSLDMQTLLFLVDDLKAQQQGLREDLQRLGKARSDPSGRQTSVVRGGTGIVTAERHGPPEEARPGWNLEEL